MARRRGWLPTRPPAFPAPPEGFDKPRDGVAKGKLERVDYDSKTVGVKRWMQVYTPPGYEKGTGRFPVLYLIHGGSDTEETWTKVGHANLIADNLIAKGLAVPMIIVMPYGNVRPHAMSDFTTEVIQDILPFIEANYHVSKESSGRAIAGFSKTKFDKINTITIDNSSMFYDLIGPSMPQPFI
jgi:enterochelin esterase family protein